MVKDHWTLYLLVGLICIVSTMVLMDRYYVPKGVQPNKDYEELIENIDSLSSHVESLNKEKDSLQMVIDTTKSKIDTINHWYEKELIDIVNQPIGDDVRFFSDYLSKTHPGFIDSNNSDTIKAD